MSLTTFRLFAAWRPALAQFLRGFTPVETEPPAYPFAPLDVAQLHRLTVSGKAGSLDDQTWRDLLLDPNAGIQKKEERVAQWLARQRHEEICDWESQIG
jgi:hypothetical protein